jgi:hypothetical protein
MSDGDPPTKTMPDGVWALETGEFGQQVALLIIDIL